MLTHLNSTAYVFEMEASNSMNEKNLLVNPFSEGGTLKKHILTVHEGHKEYKCNFCGKFFTHVHVFKTHIRTVHNKK